MGKGCVTVEVTKRDITLGKAKSPTCCPVARALARAFKVRDRWRRISVDDGHLFVADKLDVAFPPSVSDFIFDFDNQMPVAPFIFRVRP